MKKISKDKKIKVNKNIKINKPLSGSLANVWTELRIPDLTQTVPHILKVKVAIDNMTTIKVDKIRTERKVKFTILIYYFYINFFFHCKEPRNKFFS